MRAPASAITVEIIEGITVKALRSGNGTAAIPAVETSAGSIACDQVIVSVGPWVNAVWNPVSNSPFPWS